MQNPHIYIDLGHSLEYQLKKSRAEVLRSQRNGSLRQIIHGGCSSPMDAARSAREFLYQVLERTIAGATTINIPDTVGYMTPSEFGDLIGELKKTSPT